MASVRGSRRGCSTTAAADRQTVLDSRVVRAASFRPETAIKAISYGRAPLAALLLTAFVGCRTGGSGASSSWSMFGGAAKSGDALAAAPAFDGDVQKPSETAKPYPTTSTPEGYVIAKTPAAAQGDAAAPPAEVGPVVYGSAPPPALAATRPDATPDTVTAAAPGAVDTPISSISPQVGPYAASTPAVADVAPTTPAASTATAAMAPAGATAAPAAGSMFSRMPAGDPGIAADATPPERMADARAVPAWSTERVPSPPADARYDTSARYGDPGSRFGTPATEAAAGGFGAAPAAAAWPPSTPAAPASSPAMATPASTVPPAAAPTASAIGPPSASAIDPMPAFPAAPAADFSPAAAAPATPTGLPPAATTPPAGDPGAPMRRRDPVYRPGGTSSYRRLGDDGPVQPASFEAEAAATTAPAGPDVIGP